MNLQMRSEMSPLGSDEPGRFRALLDWFIASVRDGVYIARIGTTAERAVDLMHALSVHLDPAVDVVMTDWRTGTEWVGVDVALPDLREALGRLRFPLATYGGVELTVVGPDDQLSLTPELLLVIYARSDRWYFLLDGLGLSERAAPPAPVWVPTLSKLAHSPELATALAAAAARLGLTAGPASTER
ncbi:hypothetical protein [Gemmatimonas sp.]|uniref:hypothetical protein n=1 Tax=Gemmatimonas sp. TaxID=1962908 RepID=UPI003568007A